MLSTLNHRNIIKLQRIVRSEHGLCIVMDYGGDDLAYQFDHQSLSLTESQTRSLMKQLLQGVAYLHQNQIIHRDLKLSNILVDKSQTLKICDFGLARHMSFTMTSGVVTLWYRAPEVLFGMNHYTPAIDMWSVGCIFAELLNLGNPILPGNNPAHQLQLICKLIGPPSSSIWPEFSRFADKFRVPEHSYNTLNVHFSKYSRACIDFLNSLLVWDPSQRLTAAEALLSDYIIDSR